MIGLNVLTVSGRMKDYGEIKALMLGAFPKNERLPMWLLRLSALRKNVRFLAYYENDVFCGLSYSISDRNTVFLLYLAVNDKLRSRGYGTAILDHLKEMYRGLPILLNAEMSDALADNNIQREKRLEFYRRNGFYDTGFVCVTDGVKETPHIELFTFLICQNQRLTPFILASRGKNVNYAVLP